MYVDFVDQDQAFCEAVKKREKLTQKMSLKGST